MWKLFWSCAAVFAAASALVLLASANSVFLFKHPQSPDTRIVVDSSTGAAIVMKAVDPASAAAPATHPRLELPQTEHDFGTMNALSEGKHEFVVRNVGEAPLALKVGSTSCKCTVAGLEREMIAPGEEASVVLRWTTGTQPLYSHYATIHTSDPARRTVDLVVRGGVLTLLGADVSEIVLPSLVSGEPAQVAVLLYSHVWDKFEVQEFECSLPGLTQTIGPVECAPGELEDAKCVRKLVLKVPGDLPVGDHSATVRLAAIGPEGARQQRLEIPIHATVQPPISVIGGQVDPHGNIDLGNLRQGRGQRVRLVVKVRDRRVSLAGAQVATFPQFLKARLTPRAEAESRGLYDLEIEVPADAPPGQYRANPRGEVRIETGDPRLGDLKLGVSFAVVPNG
jgi:hypothetical protein